MLTLAVAGCTPLAEDWKRKYEIELKLHTSSIAQRDLVIAQQAARLAELEGAVTSPAAAEQRRLVLTSFQPLYSFASAVTAGSPCVAVVNLAPPRLSPHDFVIDDPAHADRCRDFVRRAEALVTLRSLPLAPAFDRLYPWCRRENIRVVEIDPAVLWDPATPRLPLIENPRDTARARQGRGRGTGGEGRGKGTAVLNPHVWLSLSHAVRLVEGIARDVAALDPDHAGLYRANAARYQRELRALKAEYEAKFASIDRLSVAALTEGFPYLTADFGIETADYILEPENAAEIEARVRAAGVKVVIAEETPAPEILQAVETAGAKVVVLTTIEEGWDPDPTTPALSEPRLRSGRVEGLDPDGYLKAMRSNLERLLGAL